MGKMMSKTLEDARENVIAFMQDWDRGEALAQSDRRTLNYADVAELLEQSAAPHSRTGENG